jgi:hypothetical protein
MFAWEHSGRRSVAADDPQNGPLDCPAWADVTPAGALGLLAGPYDAVHPVDLGEIERVVWVLRV